MVRLLSFFWYFYLRFLVTTAGEESICCPWIDDNNVPELILPRPCQDLIVNFNLLMDLIQVFIFYLFFLNKQILVDI